MLMKELEDTWMDNRMDGDEKDKPRGGQER
jgi:hypothetical protein